MSPIYIFFFIFFIGMNSCQKDKEVFEEVLEESISENQDNTDSSNDDSTETGDDNSDVDIDKEDGFDNVLKAFPSAYGAGSQVTGGRGQKAFFVTNLEDAGPGSFRQALVDAGNNNGGTILFRVSGTIELKERTYFKLRNITIAGQSAPEGGVDITGTSLVFENSDNIVIRYLRFRPDYGNYDSLGFLECDNIIVDHCSLSWGGDEVLDFWGDTDNVTVQKLLIAEGKTGALFGDSDNPSISEDLSMHNCLFYNISHRFPNPNSNGRIDVVNNVVFNWKYRLSTPTGNVKLNHINNYYALGCLSSPSGLENKIFEGDSPRIYTSGNYVDKGILTQSKQDNWVLWRNFYSNSQASTSFKEREPYDLLGNSLPIVSAEQAFDNVLEDVGANKLLDENGDIIYNQDNLDVMYLSNVISKNCVEYVSSSFGQNYASTPHYLNYHSAVNSSPRARHSANFDSDLDGMPDVWEVRTFGDLSKNGRQDSNGNGYSDLEEYLNLVDSL